MFTNKPIYKFVLSLLIALFFFSCNEPQKINKTDQKSVINEVRAMLLNLNRDIKFFGLISEFRYLDSSENFFWVLPGFKGALSYDSVVKIINSNDAQNKKIDNTFDSLAILPLSKDIAVYTGLLRSEITDSNGKKEIYRLTETGIVIKKKGYWKLLCGQTDLQKGYYKVDTQMPNNYGLDFFAGKWDFQIWYKDNTTAQPDISAEWTLEKSLENAECYTGKVEINGTNFTSEIIAFNSFKNEYERIVITNNGDYVSLHTKGWDNKRLVWLGSRKKTGQRIELKEEITKLDEDKFEAKFFQLTENNWQWTQTEILTRIK